MARERPKVSAKAWSEKPDGGFVATTVKVPDDVSYFEPKKAGVYRIEIVPYEVPKSGDAGPNPNAQPGELHYERTYFTHRGIGVDERSYVCPAKTAGKPCPICEHRKELMRDKDGDEELIKELTPKQRQLWNVYDHADADKGVQIWDISFHLFGKQLKKEVRDADEDEGIEYFADPEEGMTLRVGFDEKHFGGNSYLETSTIGFRKRKGPLPDKILDAAQPLDNLLIVLDYDKLKAILFQEEGGVDDKDDKDDKDDDDDFKSSRKCREEAKEEAPKQEKTEKPKPKTADELGISKGDDVTWKGSQWTVLKITDDGTTVTLMNDDDTMKKGVPVDEVAKPGKHKKEEPKKDPPKTTSPGKAKVEDDWDDDEPKEKAKAESKKETAKAESKKEGKEDDWDQWD